MPERRTDTAATPAPDDTLREMARTITAHVRLGGTTRCSCGEIWQPLHVAEALREHVAAAVQAERERAATAVEELPGPNGEGVAKWPKQHADVYMLAIEEAAGHIRALDGTEPTP